MTFIYNLFMNSETRKNVQSVALVAAAYVGLWTVGLGIAEIIERLQKADSSVSKKEKSELTIEQKIALAMKIAKGEDGEFSELEKGEFASFFGHPRPADGTYPHNMKIESVVFINKRGSIYGIRISDDNAYTPIEKPEINRYLDAHKNPN